MRVTLDVAEVARFYGQGTRWNGFTAYGPELMKTEKKKKKKKHPDLYKLSAQEFETLLTARQLLGN